MRNVGLDEAQAGIKISRRNINNLRYADDTTLMAESEEELETLLMKVKVESEKVGLKLNIQKTKIMASSPITSWQKDGEPMERVRTIFLGSKITADGDCSHEIKRSLLSLWAIFSRMSGEQIALKDRNTVSLWGRGQICFLTSIIKMFPSGTKVGHVWACSPLIRVRIS